MPPKCQQDTDANTLRMEAIETNPNAKRSTSHKVSEQQLICSSLEDV
jgi:hypothetical protein